MEKRVYYFSRTGTSKKLATEIAEKENAMLHEITDEKNWNGAIGFFKGGMDSTLRKSSISFYTKPGEYDEIFLVMPLWAGTFPPSIRGFLKEVPRERVKLYVTSDGSKLKDREGFISITDVVKKENE